MAEYLAQVGFCDASALTRSRMKASWTYIGCSTHSVPSLSKVATRCSTGTKSGPPCWVARATKSMIDFLVGPSFHEGNPSLCVCENAGVDRSAPINEGSSAKLENRRRRVRPVGRGGNVFMLTSSPSTESNAGTAAQVIERGTGRECIGVCAEEKPGDHGEGIDCPDSQSKRTAAQVVDVDSSIGAPDSIDI